MWVCEVPNYLAESRQKQKIMCGMTARASRDKVLEIFKDSELPEIAKANKGIWVWMECWFRLRSRSETFEIICQAFAEKVSRLHGEKRALEITVHNQREELKKVVTELQREKDYLSYLRLNPNFQSLLKEKFGAGVAGEKG